MPYAAKALIQHEFDTDHLNIWIEFKHPMDQDYKPLDTVWIVKLDDVETAITSSTWIDEYTLLLTIDEVAADPGRVTVQYDGPDPLLTTTWGKQWSPWGAIASIAGWPTTFKYGMIILWYGSVVAIPSGWHLCDGTENTPDLRDKFVIGAGDTYDPNDTGGEASHNHTATQASHNHSIVPGMELNAGAYRGLTTDSKTPAITVASKSTLPPYYALCYIMKL